MTRFRLTVHLNSGKDVSAIWETSLPDAEEDDAQLLIIQLLEEHPREFIALGDLIVHSGAIGAITILD